MSYTPAHKARTRARILAAARRLFNAHGYHGVTIDAVMAAANLTRGGFYAHFKSKEDLFAAALKSVLGSKKPPPAVGQAPSLTAYLSPFHRDHRAEGCPVAAHLSAMALAPEAARAAFTDLVTALAPLFADAVHARETRPEGTNTAEPASSDQALAVMALAVGGLNLARGVKDPALSDRILAASRQACDLLARDWPTKDEKG